jgi:tRNA-2-methylthio-N6-dimethylallyladenosine synthase
MNKLDSALVAGALKDAGFALTEKVKEADVVLINTCSVRQHAEDRVLSYLGHLKHIKETRPGLVVGVIGCMAQRLGAELLDHEAVDIVCGPAQISQIPELVKRALEEPNKLLSVTENIRRKCSDYQSGALDTFEATHDSDKCHIPHQAFVRVMRGCNNFCSYCVVPYVRGPEVSRVPEAIIEQIKRLAADGVRQITLLGQTINSYNHHAGDRTYRLADLLEMASEVEGVRRIRFITSYPAGFDESILHAMADLPKVCPYLHIPAQSGSDRILKAMNRRYTASEYLDLLAKARDIVDGIAIAGDFIVGFGGETDADFAATVELVKKANYKNCFVFKYSPRPGTRADDKLADTVPADVKKRRNIELLSVQNEISGEYNNLFLGQTLEVLVEGASKKPLLDSAKSAGHPQLVGRTATDYIVVFNGPLSLAGEFTKVKIAKISPLTLFGRLPSL